MKKKTRTATFGVFDKVEVEQLGYCNAFVRRCYKIDRCLGHVLCRKELVSYCTPVISVVYDMDGNITQVNAAQAATCSTSTRKQVGRFLREIGCELCYLDIKDALNKTAPQPASIIDNIKRLERGADYLDRWDIMPYTDPIGLLKAQYESIKTFQYW